jgi:hypothetical protein
LKVYEIEVINCCNLNVVLFVRAALLIVQADRWCGDGVRHLRPHVKGSIRRNAVDVEVGRFKGMCMGLFPLA